MQPTTTETIRSVNPATGETLATLKQSSAEEVHETVQHANRAQADWQALGLEGRARILKELGFLLSDRRQEIAELITTEMGRPITESLVMEVEATIDLIDYYSRKHRQLLSDRRIALHNLFFKRRTCTLHHQPLGTLAVIAPWNWPLLLPMGTIVPALLAGNAVVFKHSDLTPLMGQQIETILHQAGVPDTIFRAVVGGAHVGQALVASDVVKIFFTGSTQVGRAVYQQAAGLLKKCVLELGGNDPAIVCDDADIEAASSGIVWGAFNNCGQNCNSIERVYVHKRIANAFVDSVVGKTKQLKIGSGMDPEVDIGPLASHGQWAKIRSIAEDAKLQGLECLTGGEDDMSFKGCFYSPTVFLRKASDLHPPDQEIFGPLLFITPVEDDEQALQLANRSEYGLSASVWTQNRSRGHQLAQRLESGNVMINDCIVSFGMPEMGWSGLKKSGIGWVHGEKGLDEMVNIQDITLDPQSRMQKFWWFPYTPMMIDSMHAALDALYSRSIWKKIRALPTVLRRFIPYLVQNRPRSDKL
jgi:succinate-semialdehyde dehydrogenase/glutarate-semialdehyde dehydrogenase